MSGTAPTPASATASAPAPDHAINRWLRTWITHCAVMGMNITQTEAFLAQNFNIDPTSTHSVWEKMYQEHLDALRRYNLSAWRTPHPLQMHGAHFNAYHQQQPPVQTHNYNQQPSVQPQNYNAYHQQPPVQAHNLPGNPGSFLHQPPENPHVVHRHQQQQPPEVPHMAPGHGHHP